MKISIIIPVFNAEKYLKRLLDSINIQTYSEYEVILINDGSTDSSELILKEYVKKNKKIKLRGCIFRQGMLLYWLYALRVRV